MLKVLYYLDLTLNLLRYSGFHISRSKTRNSSKLSIFLIIRYNRTSFPSTLLFFQTPCNARTYPRVEGSHFSYRPLSRPIVDSSCQLLTRLIKESRAERKKKDEQNDHEQNQRGYKVCRCEGEDVNRKKGLWVGRSAARGSRCIRCVVGEKCRMQNTYRSVELEKGGRRRMSDLFESRVCLALWASPSSWKKRWGQ